MQKSFKLTTSEIKNLTKFSYILTDAEYPLQVQPPVCCSDNNGQCHKAPSYIKEIKSLSFHMIIVNQTSDGIYSLKYKISKTGYLINKFF